MEDKYSKNLMYLNQERISNIYKGTSINKVFTKMKLIAKYVLYGDFSYALFRIRNRKSKEVALYDGGSYEVNSKVVIYTVQFGNYDNLYDPLYVNDNVDYYVLTDSEHINSNVWKKKNVIEYIKKNNLLTSLECARFFKTHPHLLFPEYDVSIFVDANIQIVSDVTPLISLLNNNFIAVHKQPGRNCIYQEATEIVIQKKAKYKDVMNQVGFYKNEGFPKGFGLFQTNVLIRLHNDINCIKVMEDWWHEMTKFTKRDQLSFTYVFWKTV